MGKAGAAVGTQVFQPIENNLGVRWTFIIAAIVGLCGMVVTWFFVPDLNGDDLAIEDERFRAYLVGKGWSGEMGEGDLKDTAEAGVGEWAFDEREDSTDREREVEREDRVK
jgi:hypothetical protein